jgi:hypothetical protein
MTARRILLIFVLTIFSVNGFSQKLHVKASNEPLSSVFKRLNVEVSFDNRLLSEYKVTLDKSFSSPYKAIVYLLDGKPLQVKKVAGVFVITEKPNSVVLKSKTPKIEYKHVIIKAPDSPPVNLSVSLKEIVITAKNHTPYLKGEEPDGTNRFNSFTASAMPGYSDNLVFNVLRMMPGIRASGEPSDELYVWGSSPGESRISFDGIPLFTMQSYNSNISYINPYMFEEVRYKRGILSVGEGSQTGAKIDVMTGMPPASKMTVKAMVSTMSVNCFASIPVSRKCVMSLAYRHTLDGLFGGTTFDAYRNKNEKEHSSDEHSGSTTTTTGTGGTALASTSVAGTISPSYRFQDLNLNVTGKGAGNTSYRITLYGAKDYLDYNSSDTLTTIGDQTSYQGGISFHADKTWKNGNKSELSSFYSGLYSTQNGTADSVRFVSRERVFQYNVKLMQTGLGKVKGLSCGGELMVYRVNGSSAVHTAIQPSLFADEKLNWGALNMEAGLRTDIMSNGIKWQPRLLLHYLFMKYFTLTSSWGIYNQYLVKDPFAIADGLYKFNWDINTSLKSYHTVAGIAFDKGGLNVSVEAYLKNIRHSQWVVNNQLGSYNFNLRGMDVSAKYNWRHGLFFTSWSLAKDLRQMDGVSNEIKVGGIMRFYPFTFSANYVYSSGYNSSLLPVSAFRKHEESKELNANTGIYYSRMDVAASYEKRFRYFSISMGLSLINVFDTYNKKYITSSIPRDYSSSFYAQASRFTPIIFIEIKI